MRTCANCQNFQAQVGSENKGSCRAKSPKAFLMPGNVSRMTGQMGPPMVLGIFPSVETDWWCGEHKGKIL